jgi:hypothetical protein
MRNICVAIMLTMLLSTQAARSEPLQGEISTSATPEGPEHAATDLFPTPSTESADEAQSDMGIEHHRFDRATKFGRLVNGPGVYINIVQLSGGHSRLGEALAGLMDRNPMLTGNAQQQLSCIGIMYEFASGTVLRVLPGSDLYGIIAPGDRFIAEDGHSPFECWQRGLNFGSAGSITQVTFIGKDGIQTVACHRKPISELLPGFGTSLNWASLPQ